VLTAIGLALLLLTARWWLPLLAALLGDLRAASAASEAWTDPEGELTSRAAPARADSRIPLNRVLAFRGVARRVSARGRWQAGFGRRGL
jgi:hypothetical protein